MSVQQTGAAKEEGFQFRWSDEEALRLSPRECEIARLVAAGYPNKTIAGILDISPWTVAAHIRRVFDKLGVHGRAAMVTRLVEAGFCLRAVPRGRRCSTYPERPNAKPE